MVDVTCRKLGVQEDELRRAVERAELAENKLKAIEEELQLVGFCSLSFSFFSYFVHLLSSFHDCRLVRT